MRERNNLMTTTAAATHKMLHVGHTSTEADYLRIIEVMEWLRKNGVSRTESKFIDLRRGQDFFDNQEQFDSVLLHFVGQSSAPIPSDILVMTPELAMSPKASWGEWRRSLIQTRARFIFAFGGFGEVSGPYICNLEGYKTHRIRTEDLDKRIRREFKFLEAQLAGFWVFEKEQL